MTTHFISAEIELQETPAQLHKEIEQELQKRGEPLRWSISSVNELEEKALVEAIVTVDNKE